MEGTTMPFTRTRISLRSIPETTGYGNFRFPALERVSQLAQRTNQFNLSTIRRTEDEINALYAHPQFNTTERSHYFSLPPSILRKTPQLRSRPAHPLSRSPSRLKSETSLRCLPAGAPFTVPTDSLPKGVFLKM